MERKIVTILGWIGISLICRENEKLLTDEIHQLRLFTTLFEIKLAVETLSLKNDPANSAVFTISNKHPAVQRNADMRCYAIQVLVTV